MAKTKLLPTWLAGIILAALGFVEKKLNQAQGIPDLIRSAMHLQLRPIRLSIQAISDNDPQNAEQVKNIWLQHTGTTMIDFGKQITSDVIDKINSENIRMPLHYLAPKIFGMGPLLTDADPENAKQIEQHWGAVLRDDEMHEVTLSYLVGPALEKVLDPSTTKFILQLIDTALDQHLEKESQKAIASRSVSAMPVQVHEFSRERALRIKEKIQALIRDNPEDLFFELCGVTKSHW